MVAKKELYTELMNHREREMRTRISLLEWTTENTIRDIEGRVVDGTITIDGNSPVRRSCQLSMIVDKNITTGQERISDLISINKKAQVHIGLKNTTRYKEMGEYIWFNLGVYVLTDVVYMHDLDNATINITALDKMCLWSGDVSGEIQEAVNLAEYKQLKGNGEYEIIRPTFYQIVHRLVTVFGAQNPGKVVINDIEDKIKRVIKKTTPGDMYFSKKDNAFLPSIEGMDRKDITTITQGEYLYVYEPFRPDAEQIDSYQLNVGQTITSALDLVKNQLGNYEYFFDLDGNFVFQEIKNFQNTSFTTDITNVMSVYSSYAGDEQEMDYDNSIKPIQSIAESDYITNFSKTPYTYSFEESEIATGFTNTPDWKGIKNNFVVYGGEAGNKMLHIAIDKKPVSPSIWYVDDNELSEVILAPEYYIGIQNIEGLWGIYVDNNFKLTVRKLEGDIVPQHIFQESFLLKDHLTEDYSRVTIKDGSIKFKDEFFPGDEIYYNGVVVKSQYGCECLLYSYDSYPQIMKPFRFLNFMQAPNDKVYLIYPNFADKIVIEETNEKFFTNIFDATGTPLPDYTPKKEFILHDNSMNSKALKITNDLRLYAEDTELIAERDNYFIPTLKGGGVNIVIHNNRLQFEKTYTRAIPYNQPWQQYIIDLGDEIKRTTPGGDAERIMPEWYTELKTFFPLIYKRNENYWGGNWLKSYTTDGKPVYDGMGDSSIWPYYFDIIDENTELGKYSISAIGKRTKAVAQEDITMLYPPIRRNYILLKPTETEDTELMEWLNAKEQPYLILKEDDEYMKNFSYAVYGKDAFTKIREMIYLHTSLNETVNISSLPLYFLEPNTKIIAKDEETHTTGDYVILNLTFPLQFDAMQNLTCIKVGSRL